jgi:trk system potassium uptake protein TrkH
MGDTAKILYLLYFVLSLAETVCLLLAGMNVYDALIHTFGTAGTGGFSNYNASVGAFHSPLIEWIIGTFMMLFGVNFAIYFHLMRREKEPILQSEELWTYLGIVAAATMLVTLDILPRYGAFFEALRNAYFQVTSIVSTTGFGTADFNMWPLFSRTLILLLMCMGACAGSTAGGFKMSRVLLLFKSAYRDLEHTLQPRKVAVVRFEGKPVQESTLSQVGVYLSLWFCLVIVGTLLLSIRETDLVTALTAALTCLSNVGPGLSRVGPVENFAFFSYPAKLLLSLLMLAGRLEIYPILLLFSVHVWKKS